MPLYHVKINQEFVFFSQSLDPEEIKKEISSDLKTILPELEAKTEMSTITSAGQLPEGWDEDSLPFGDDDDSKTIKDFLPARALKP